MESKKRSAEEADLSQPESSSKRSTLEPPVQSTSQLPISREPSIFGIRPPDDIVSYLADFIAPHVGCENVEIEAKLGVFLNKQTDQRINIGAITETILDRQDLRQYRFESNMTLDQHCHFNKMLNERVNKSRESKHKGEVINYKHTKQTDCFFLEPGQREKRRMTKDQEGKIVPGSIIEKTRVVDLNIHAPRQPLDYRISINLETPRSKPTTEPVYERIKDRISYKHGGISFDLTQVKQENASDFRHELELEIADPKILAIEKKKRDRKEHSQYDSMVEIFVNNIRMLSRLARK